MSQGGQEDRLAKVHAAARVRSPPPQVGGGTYVFVALPEPPHEQGLREALRQRGGVCLRGHGSFDGEAPGPCLRISKQFLRNCLEIAGDFSSVGFCRQEVADRLPFVPSSALLWTPSETRF